MKIKKGLCILLSLLIALAGFPAEAESEAVQNLSIQDGSHSIDGKVPILGSEQLIKNAEAILLYEINTDTIMYSWNADEQKYPASLVKIMTALLVLEQGKLDDVVTVSAGAVASLEKGAVSADLVPDEVISVENLLYCMLVDSANDAASVLAEHIAGSQEAFVQMMNSRAQELGCTQTHFVNPHGLHDDAQVTTARDVGRILREAMMHEEFQAIFGTVNYTIPITNKSQERLLETGNFLMNLNSMEIYYDARVTGGRTGVTKDGKRCIAATAQENNLSFISVVMGAASEYEEGGNKVKSFGGFPETTQLLNHGFEGYRAAKIVFEGQALKQYPVPNGDADVVVCSQSSISTVLTQSTDVENLAFRYQEKTEQITAPIEKGQLISSLEIWNDGICIGQAELYAMNQVRAIEKKPEFPEQGQDNIKKNQFPVVIVAAIACIFLLVFLYRLIIRQRIASKRRRNRENRRRSR